MEESTEAKGNIIILQKKKIFTLRLLKHSIYQITPV